MPFWANISEAPQPFLYGFRGRMDERYDLVRSVTDGRFVYLRNYMPHKISGQHLDYMFQTPTTRVWKKLHDAGKLNAAQDRFWNTKPAEELYDLQSDPDEVNNLAAAPAHRELLERLRKAQRTWPSRFATSASCPRARFIRRSAGSTPFDMAQSDRLYPFQRIFDMAEAGVFIKARRVARVAEGVPG